MHELRIEEIEEELAEELPTKELMGATGGAYTPHLMVYGDHWSYYWQGGPQYWRSY